MLDIVIETLLDGVKLIPFLFIAFLIIESIEHSLNRKSTKIISKSGKIGPLFGSILGVFPQCGFSVMATNLYISRIITLGTLISIYLSTSDEMLAILISSNVSLSIIFKILGIKVIVGMISGFIIDFILRKRKIKRPDYSMCETTHCHCEDGVLVSTIKHVLNTVLFVILVSFILNIIMEYVGEDGVSKIFLKNSFLSPFVASIIGLIPNCGASVILTELYINNAISLGASIAGLLTGSGVAILVLFKSNKNMKENLFILGLIYGIGVISGIIIELIGMIF